MIEIIYSECCNAPMKTLTKETNKNVNVCGKCYKEKKTKSVTVIVPFTVKKKGKKKTK